MDFTRDFFNLISDFGEEWVITNIEPNFMEKTVHIHMKYSGTKYYDPDTEQESKLYDHSPQRVWRHLDIWDYQTYIVSRIPRVKTGDGKVKTIRYGWADSHDRHTYSFEIKVIETLKATKNQTKTAELLNCSFRLVNTILHGCTQRGLDRRNKEEYQIQDISIDEKSFKRGHKYVTVLSHPRSGCVLEVGENRDEKSVRAMLESRFTTEQLLGINTVSMDMWQAYENAVKKYLPNAEIVHDKFHLVKHLNEAIDKVRRREVKDNEVLKYGRYTLLKNDQNRTEFQKELFEQIMESNLNVTKVYYAKETFKSLFNTHNDDYQATENLKSWANEFFMQGIKELNKVILMFLKHFKGITNAMISTFTNAQAERLNGKIQEVKLCGRGYRKFENFRNAILFFHAGLNLYPLKW